EDVAAVTRHGRERGIAVVARGAGHSVDGQPLSPGGIVVVTDTLADVRRTGPDRVSAGAGARWSAVVAATLPDGLAPPVLPDYLELSVGGVLAAGGVGGACHRHGFVADNVHDLDVVTPDGALVTCSPTERPGLFDAVRGGQGRHGVITRATLALTAAPALVRRHELSYRDLGVFLADQALVAASQRFAHVEGHARHVAGAGWWFGLHAVADVDADASLPEGLRPDSAHVETGPYLDFLHRAAPVEAHLRATGSWQRDPHPRITLLVPGRHAASLVGLALDDLPPEDVAGGRVLVYPIPTDHLAAPNVPRADDALTVVLAIPRTAPAGDPDALDRMRRANKSLTALVEEAGGARYPAA
ncbi:FAD-binding protein, partial [Saccharothrix hoggarensis]